jgi:hypothetical protein
MMKPVTRHALTAFVLLFATSHAATSLKQRPATDAYFVSLSFWTLLFTALVLAVRLPASVGAAALAANVVVCALYYTVINQGAATGQQLLLHGGCAAVLLAFAAAGEFPVGGGSGWKAGLVAAAFLLANAGAQWWHERRQAGDLVYPESSFESPLWRLAAVPLVGAGVAAALAAS